MLNFHHIITYGINIFNRSFQHIVRLNGTILLIPFAPLAVVPQRQNLPSYLPSPLVFQTISTHFTAKPSVPAPPKSLHFSSISNLSAVKPRALIKDLKKRLRIALRPINPDNACTPRITAAAGTWLAGAYSPRCVHRGKRGLRPEGLHPSRGVAASDFRPLRTIPGCCHP